MIMSALINIRLTFSEKELGAKIESLKNKRSMTAIHQTFANIINPYVPMDEGMLVGSLRVTQDYIQYKTPYAHYQYEGEIYGPNLPGWEDEGAPGWRSPDKKHPTGRTMGKHSTASLTPIWKKNKDGTYSPATSTDDMIIWDFGYNTERHPLATHHWDKIAMQTEFPRFRNEVKAILLRELKK